MASVSLKFDYMLPEINRSKATIISKARKLVRDGVIRLDRPARQYPASLARYGLHQGRNKWALFLESFR